GGLRQDRDDALPVGGVESAASVQDDRGQVTGGDVEGQLVSLVGDHVQGGGGAGGGRTGRRRVARGGVGRGGGGGLPAAGEDPGQACGHAHGDRDAPPLG